MDNAPPPQADPPAPDAPAPTPPDLVELNLRALARLTELGMKLAEVVQRQAVSAARTDPDGPTAAELAVKFTRIARSVGQTVALSTKIINDQKAASNPRPDIDRRRRAAVRAEEYRRKDRVRDTVEKSVRAHAPPGKVYDLLIELDNRLDDPALNPDLDVGRLARIVQQICRDFGVPANFDDWSDEECGFVVPHHSTVNIPPGVDPSGWFSQPPDRTLADIFRDAAEAEARKAEAKAAKDSQAEPAGQEIEPSPD